MNMSVTLIKRVGVLLMTIFPMAMVAQNNAHQQYIQRYKDVAIEQMQKYGIPASITLAQGILESDAGRSSLATEGNNHFGIKCHSDWQGRRMYHDDDRRGECFRVYRNANSSFEDHSLFLTTHSRYEDLFKLKVTDYRGWAHGLKRAGYATNPHYATKLIEIIERYKLYEYDREGSPRRLFQREREMLKSHQPYISNGLLYIIMDEDETLRDIAKEFDVSRFLLRCYNDIPRGYEPMAGGVIYLERKKNRADKRYKIHSVETGESIWSISQRYGVKMKVLMRKNGLESNTNLVVGQELRVR